MSEKDKLSFIIENMKKGLSFCRTATNFTDKKNRDISKDSLGLMLEYLEKLKDIIGDSVVIKTDLFKYFWKFLQREIRDKQDTIEHCNKERFMPYEQQEAYKKRTQKELNRLLILAEVCEIDIAENAKIYVEDLPDNLECSYCGFKTSSLSDLKLHFEEHKKEM